MTALQIWQSTWISGCTFAPLSVINSKRLLMGLHFTFCLIMMLAPSATYAQDKDSIIPIDEWWEKPSISPDGGLIAVEWPAPKEPGRIYVDKNHHSNDDFHERKMIFLDRRTYRLRFALPHVLWHPAWSPDGKLIAGYHHEDDAIGGIYETASGKCLKSYSGEAPFNFSWSTDGKHVLITSEKGAQIWSSVDNTTLTLVSDLKTNYRFPEWSPDGKRVAIAGATLSECGFHTVNAIRVFDAATGQQCSQIDNNDVVSNFETAVGKLAWSPDNAMAIYSDVAGLHVLDKELREKQRITVDTGGPASFDWSPDGKHLVYLAADEIRILDATTLKPIASVGAPKNGGTWAWSSNSRYLAVVEMYGPVAVCEVSTGKCLGYKQFDMVQNAKWFPNDETLILSRWQKPPEFVSVRLPQRNPESLVFESGVIGNPWLEIPSPKNLEECFSSLSRRLTAKDLAHFKNSKENELGAFGGGSIIWDNTISKEWHRWNTLHLNRFFKDKGITDPRDVFGIVIDSYWRHLHSKPLDLDKQIAEHKLWWGRQTSLIVESRQLSKQLQEFELKDQKGRGFSISNLGGKARLVSFVETQYGPSEGVLKSLSTLCAKYDPHYLSVCIIVYSPKTLRVKKHKIAKNEHDCATEIAGLLALLKDKARIADGELSMWNELIGFTQGRSKWFPQTLVINQQGLVTIRLNGSGFEDGRLREEVESQIDAILKSNK